MQEDIFQMSTRWELPSTKKVMNSPAGTKGTVGTLHIFLTHTCARIKPGSALVIRSPYRPHSSDPLLGEPFEPPFPGGRFSSPFSPRCVYEGLHAGGLPGAVCCVIWFFYCKRWFSLAAPAICHPVERQAGGNKVRSLRWVVLPLWCHWETHFPPYCIARTCVRKKGAVPAVPTVPAL